MSELVFDLYVLPRSEFGKHPEFLKDVAEGSLAQSRPIGCAKLTDVTPVKSDGAPIVVTIACEETAERGFAGTGRGFNQIEVSSFEADLLLPEV